MAIRFNWLKPAITRAVLTASVIAMSVSSSQAQDPLSRFLDGIFKSEPAEPENSLSSEPIQELPLSQMQPETPYPQSEQPQNTSSGLSATESPVTPAPVRQPSKITPSLKTAITPLPPPRPDGIGGAAPAPAPESIQNPATQIAAATPAKSAPQAAQTAPMPRTSAEAVDRINAYLNSINTLTARFLQTGADRRQVGGTLFVQRPGRLRFAYDPPSTLEIVADGRSVAVRDSKLRTNDVYSIGQTPLKFLLRDHVDLSRDVRVKNVHIDPNGPIEITLEDSATLGGTSTVTLRFDARTNVLREWMIVDPQGYKTTVALSGVEVVKR